MLAKELEYYLMTGIEKLPRGIDHGYRIGVQFSWLVPVDKIIWINNKMLIHYNHYYKFCFLGGDVSQENIDRAFAHATELVNNFIDNYKV